MENLTLKQDRHESKPIWDLKGMSGCGVWSYNAREAAEECSSIWQPQLRLHGIQTAQLDQGMFLKATRVEVVNRIRVSPKVE